MAVQQALKFRSNDMYANGASGLATCFYKVELDAPADFVQWVIGSSVGSGTPGTYKVQVAFTDEIRVDTATRAFVPMRAGVAYNDSSANGWKDCTFGGATSKQIGLAPSTSNASITMATDVVAMSSPARADGKPGCILLVKVVQTDSGGAFTQDKSTNQAWDLARGVHPWFREFFSVKRNGVDAITTPTALPTGVAESNTGYCMVGYPITSRSDATKAGELVMFTGDSVRAAAYSTFAYNNPNCQSLLPLSTPTRPISIVNLTGSGHSQIQYLQVAKDSITSGLRPTVIYLPGFSQNGFNNNPQGFIDRNNAFMAEVRTISGLENVKFVLDTDYWGAPLDANVRQCINYAKSLANNTTVFLFDSEAVMIDFTNASAPVRRSIYMNADNVHANQAGQDVLTYGYGPYPGLTNLYKSMFNSTTAVLPGAPVIGTSTPGNGSVTVAFTPSTSNGGSAILDHTVTAGAATGTGATSPITVTGVPPGTAVSPTMRSRNAVGTGPMSIASNSVMPTEVPVADTTPPVMTGSIAVSAVTSSGFTLAVDAATDDVGVTGYEYSIDGGTTYTTIPNAARTVTVTGRAASTSHAVRMRAFDAAGNKATPLSATATTTASADTTAPVMVAPITVSAQTTTGFTLTWPAATDAVGVASYEVDNGSGVYVNVGTARTLVVTGKTASTTYNVRVRALDAAGNAAAPLTATATTAEQPPEATNPPTFTRSLSRTINISEVPGQFDQDGKFWTLTGTRKPTGSIDPNATIDITFNWTALLADIKDTIADVQFDIIGLTNKGAYRDGAFATIFVGSAVNAPNNPPSITCRITTASVPPRVEDRTVYLIVEQQ